MKPQTAEQINKRVLVSLGRAKQDRTAMDALGEQVMIYSTEHGAYWRPMGNGYTILQDEAGIYDKADAFYRTRHCGPEKGIVFESFTPAVSENTKLKAALKEGIETARRSRFKSIVADVNLLNWIKEAEKLL